MMKHAQLVKNTKYSIYIYYSDIQIKYLKLNICPLVEKNKTIGNEIKLRRNLLKKKCLDFTDSQSFYSENENRRSLFDSVSMAITEPSDITLEKLNFLDYLFYGTTLVDDANIIRIENRTHLFQLENILEARYFQTEKFKSTSKYLDRINYLIRDFSKTLEFEKASLSAVAQFDKYLQSEVLYEKDSEAYAFVDDRVGEMVISSFFMNQDIDKMGVIIHKYSATNSIVSTSINHFSLEIEDFKGNMETVIGYAYFLVLLLLVFCFYLKYRLTCDFWLVVAASRYLFFFVIVFILENIYKLYHTFEGTNNVFFKPLGAFEINLRERFIYYKDNVKFFKAFASMAICVHLNFVIFPQEDLFVIKKLFTQVIIVFFLIILVVSLSLTFLLNFLFGVEISSYSKLFQTLLKVFGFILGIETSSSLNDEKSYESRFADLVLFFIRIIYMNFTIVVMTYTYNKLMEKKRINKFIQNERLKTKLN